jgi:signal transduction histidine kinase/ActR/RegA family two-component response regulator
VVHNAQRAAADDPELERVRRDLVDLREQFAAASEVLVSLGQSSSDNDAVLDTLVSSVCRLCRGDAAMVFLPDGPCYRLARSTGLSGEYVRFIGEHPVAADRRTLVGRVGLDRRLQQITDVLSDPEYGRHDAQRVAGFRTIVGAPMLFDERLVGVLSVWRNAVDAFDERVATLLTTFAAQAAIAISHVDLVRALELRTSELARKVDQLETLGAVIEAVNSSLDLDQVLAMIVMHAVHLSGTDGGSIMEFDDQRQEFAVRAAYGTSDELLDELRRTPIEVSSTFVGRAAMAGRPLQEPALRSVARDAHQDRLYRAGWMSMLAVPLLRESKIVGVLVVLRKSAGDYSEETANVLQSLADQSALAILNARVFRELERKGRELEIASGHKSEFLASMSHELRTPLNAVIGFSQVLLERMFGELNDRQDEYLRDILGSGQHLLELLNDVLDLSKVEAGRMELNRSTFGVREAIEYSLSMVRERAQQRSITIDYDITDRVQELFADRLRITQVIVNLVSNAVKFTPAGGRISVTATTDGSEVAISVSDSGPGVPAEDRERIFESFQQGGRGADREEGTGLGLTLSRRIVELHDGRMWLHTELGAGSTFGFAVPVLTAPEGSSTSEAAEATNGSVVVVIDDDPGAMELLTLYLHSAALTVVGAGTGAAGLHLTRQLGPVAVVLDIRLPDIDGWELLSTLKRDPVTMNVPVLIVSVVDERAQGLLLGAADYLVKPVGRDLVLGSLARIGVLPASAAPDVAPTDILR